MSESMEQADHAKEAARENRKIALLIAVIALCLALSETLGKGAQTEFISKNVEESDLWAFYQAKTIRRTVVQTAAEQSKLLLGMASDEAAGTAAQKQIEDWQRTAARYGSEPETGEGSAQLSARATHAQEERDLADRQISSFRTRLRRVPDRNRACFRNYHNRRIALAWISGLLALAGIVIVAFGVINPHILPLY